MYLIPPIIYLIHCKQELKLHQLDLQEVVFLQRQLIVDLVILQCLAYRSFKEVGKLEIKNDQQIVSTLLGLN